MIVRHRLMILFQRGPIGRFRERAQVFLASHRGADEEENEKERRGRSSEAGDEDHHELDFVLFNIMFAKC